MMKTTWFSLLALGTGLMIGCSGQSPAGGPGASKNSEGAVRVTQAENTFELDVPNAETDIKQGQAQTVRIGINRGKQFDQDVKLEFAGAPKGVKVTPATPVAKPEMKEVAVTIEAAPDAPLGEFKLTVTGTPAREGLPTTGDFKVEIHKAD